MANPEVSAHNVIVDCQDLHAELLDLETGAVWQSHRPISREAYLELEPREKWSLRTETLESKTTIHLPNPTQAWFFASGASFQGPVETFGASGS